MLVISSAKIMFFLELIKSCVFFCLFLSHFMSECKKRKVEEALILSQHDIEDHHQDETYREANGAEVGVLATGGFWDKLFNNNIEHGSGSKGQHVWQDGH